MFWKGLVIVGVVMLSGCGTSVITPYTSETTGEKVTDCSSLEPRNPYPLPGGHYAGYEWAESKDVSSCGGNSNSFIEGCESYLEQSSDYEECLNH
jgi:hypothetical protein